MSFTTTRAYEDVTGVFRDRLEDSSRLHLVIYDGFYSQFLVRLDPIDARLRSYLLVTWNMGVILGRRLYSMRVFRLGGVLKVHE